MSTYHRFLLTQAHNISMATGRCVWPFMIASQLKKKLRWCSWFNCGRGRGHGWWNACLMSGGCGREDGRWRRTYHFHPSMSVAVLCGETVKEKNRNVYGVARRQRKSSWQVKCVLDWRRPWECRPPMETNWPSSLVLWQSAWWKWARLIFFCTLCQSRRWYFRPNHVNLLAKKSVVSQLWGPPKWDLNYPNTMLFGDSIASPTWDLVWPTENTILVVF